ncbi:hypothetical protein QBC37DRAFT_378566 [Rhypophila decipiens]|uniref:Uncharacterized protein n=1 Tax=Rhypophila decipiens TaxID=261697 RepID=A0AAN6XYC0_9PEZI|nr:hypothetical protein QBC37DRAFT_378566 [Rhypophila decipiens]
MAHIRRLLDERRFRLGYDKENRYGIQVVPQTSTTSRDHPTRKAIPVNSENKASLFLHMSARTWDFTIQITALVFTLGLLILILYYENTVGPVNSKFESFMNSQTIGVRILFASFGTTIDAFWNYYFSYTSSSQIHQLLSLKPHLAQDSILLSPPSNIFLGLWRTIFKLNIPLKGIIKKDQPLLLHMPSLEFHICLATFFAKFTPLLLSNIPFSNAVTWKIHEVCTWLAVAFLGYMVVVLVVTFTKDWLPVCRASCSRMAQFFPSWKGRGAAAGAVQRGDDDGKDKMLLLLAVRTDTIAGWLAAGPLARSQRERDRLVVGMGRWYGLGERKVQDAADGIGETGVRVDYE